mmetsp:Transcript_9700/g.13728  ORF Transcript_9700/g.13728 Transcript_9700/m.13728 type:complete len:120 (+) Transcript_9700:132-491(+)
MISNGRGIHRIMIELFHLELFLMTSNGPSMTFCDDPLHHHQELQFGERYNVTLYHNVRLADMYKNIYDPLHVEIRQERIKQDLEAKTDGKTIRPMLSLKRMIDLKLAGCVFIYPNETII